MYEESKSFYIIDGDMSLQMVSKCVDACGYWNSPMIFRTQLSDDQPPSTIRKILRESQARYQKVTLTRPGKESADKAILMMIQKQISLGARDITVFARDRDFQLDCLFLISINRDVKLNINVVWPYFGQDSEFKVDSRVNREERLKVIPLDVGNFKTLSDQVNYAMKEKVCK